MNKFLLILIVLCSSIISHAETLFYKKDSSLITPQEHDVLYKIMLETQFPMSLMYGSYVDDEIKAMNEKIKSKLPSSGIEAIFIPTTLYELFVLKFIWQNMEAGKVDKALSYYLGGFDKNPHVGRWPKCKYIVSLEVSEFKNANLNQNLINFHLTINNFIATHPYIPFSFNQAIKMASQFPQPMLKWLLQERMQAWNIKRRANAIPDMQRAIAIEYNAFSTNQFVLYRGANFIDDENSYDIKSSDIPLKYALELRENRPFARSISFGNSLLSGILCDRSACPYFYLATKEMNYGYVVFIDKKSYAFGTLNNMFFIPPLISLLGLISQGEFFHARTKVTNMDAYTILGFEVIGNRDALKPYYQITANSIKDAEEIALKTFKYIKDHHLIFRESKARL